METMGHVFKATRERKRISLSAAAARTRIKLQHLEMMERDDFSRMPAPAYARGFIRMYADFLGLESGPLVEEYNRLHQPGAREKAPPPPPRRAAPAPAPVPVEAEPEETEPSSPPSPPAPTRPPAPPLEPVVLAAVLKWLTLANLRRVGVTVLVVLVVWFLAAGLTRCVRHLREKSAEQPLLAPRKGVPAVVQEPPDPYLPVPNPSGAQP